MQQYFSNNLSLKSLMYKIREQNVVFTASKPNNVIDVNIVYRIFEFIKVKKKNASFKVSRPIDVISVKIVYQISEFIMADTQSTKQSSK